MMKFLAALALFLSLPARAESLPSHDFKQRWLILMGCWENKQVNEYWCNAPTGAGTSIRKVLYDINFELRELAFKEPPAPELTCAELGRMQAEFYDVGAQVENLADMDGVDAKLKDLLHYGVSIKFDEDAGYLYWDPMMNYCIDRKDGRFRNRARLIEALKKYQREVFTGAPDWYPVGVIGGLKAVNDILGMKIPFDENLPGQ